MGNTKIIIYLLFRILFRFLRILIPPRNLKTDLYPVPDLVPDLVPDPTFFFILPEFIKFSIIITELLKNVGF